jgi:hypothetical protein
VGRPDSLSGPLGERVFAIKVCPANGDVWIATNAGLTRYAPAPDTWRYYTRADGLPSDATDAIAFDPAGNVYVGTQCDGIARASAADGYANWVVNPGTSNLPATPVGTGLPTNMINDVLVANNIVYAATTTGLAWSTTGGKDWKFVRGADWADKIRQAIAGPPAGWTERPGAILTEDYATALAVDTSGNLFLGHRVSGWEQLNPIPGGTFTSAGSDRTAGYATAFVALPNNHLLGGTYGNGLFDIGTPPPIPFPPKSLRKTSQLPAGASPPSLADLKGILRDIAPVSREENTDQPFVIPLDDDWRTEGAWLGRYGRYWCWLAAMDNVTDGYVWGTGPDKFAHSIGLGPAGVHPHDPNYLRYWIAQNFFTDDYRALEIPPIYMHSRIVHGLTTWAKGRRQAEWDDDGETYSPAEEGPGIVLRVSIPSHTFIMSLYEVNDDAQWAPTNAHRDFRINVVSDDGDQKVLLSSRIANFWGGVYKRFVVKGPVNLRIHIQRNYSFNTVFNALMVDLPDERPVGYYMSAEQWRQTMFSSNGKVQLVESDMSVSTALNGIDLISSERAKVQTIIGNLGWLKTRRPMWFAIHGQALIVPVTRWLKEHETKNADRDYRMLEATACYMAGLYDTWESLETKNGMITTRQIEKSLRWDMMTQENSGFGYEAVRNYLDSHVTHTEGVKS